MKLSQNQSLRKVMLRACSSISLLACATFVAPQTAQAVGYTWAGTGTNANWSTTANWGPVAGSPNATADTVSITAGTGNPLLNGTFLLGGFTLGAGKTLSPLSSSFVRLNMDAGAGTVTFSNAGTISSGSGGIFQIHFQPTTGNAVAVNTGTIEARNSSTVRFGANSGKDMTVNNNGGIIQTVGAGSTIELGPTTSWGENMWIQGGTISNAAGSTISAGRQIQLGAIGNNVSGTNGTIFNNSGTFNWSTPSNLLVGAMNAGITFGLVDTAGTDTEFNNASTGIANFTSNLVVGTTVVKLAALTVAQGTVFNNAGTVNISTVGNGGNAIQGMRMQVSGTTTITNTGTINLISQSTDNTTDFNANSANGIVTLSGTGGHLVMQVGGTGAVGKVGISGVATSTLINSTGHTIRGAGSIGLNSLGTLTNNGTINADDATNAMTLDPYQYLAGTNNNAGTIRASAAGGLVLSTGVFNNNATGTYQVDAGSSLTLLAGSVLNNNASGTFTVNGTIASAVGAGTINNASTITYNSSANSALNALVTGAGSLVKSGTGSLTLGGANTMTGGVTVNAGTLFVSTGSASGKSISITSSNTTNTGYVTVTTGDTTGLVVGQAINGTSIAANTVITGIIDSTHFTMNSAVTAAITASSRSISALGYSTLGTGAVTVNGGTLDLGTGSHAVAAVSLTGGAINNGTLTKTGGTFDLQAGSAGAILGGTAGATKTTGGTVTLSNANTYTGATNVNAGTLIVNGSLATGSAVTVGASGTLAGSGTVAGSVDVYGTLSPGNSPGSMATGAQTWFNGGDFNWQTLDVDGAAGTGFDTLAITGALNLSNLTAAGFSINLWSLSSIGPDVSGNALNFNDASNYQWTLASTTGGVTGFDAANFGIFTGANNGAAGFSNAFTGTFSVSADTNNLYLNYTAVPEPSTLVMLLGGAGMLTLLRRRRA